MTDHPQIVYDNNRRVEKAWTNKFEHPHAVLVYSGLHVVDVKPVTSRDEADRLANALNSRRFDTLQYATVV